MGNIFRGAYLYNEKEQLHHMRRIAYLLIFTLVISTLIVPVQTADAASVTPLSSAVKSKVTGIKSGSHLNVRSKPDASSSIVDKLTNGTSVSVTGYTSDGWLEIKTTKTNSGKGYVTARYVNVPVVSIAANAAAVTVTVGKSVTVGMTIYPPCATNKGITWTSSSTSVATVDSSGVVTGKQVGSATITAKTSDGGKTAKTLVTVTEIPVTSVSLSPTTLALNKGNSSALKATILPANASNKAVTWSSSNNAAATVDSSGKVTGTGNGSATITVKTASGGKTATCSVTVRSVPTGVSLPAKTVLSAGEDVTLTASVSPSDAVNKSVTWSSSNNSVATVNAAGKVSAISIGTATVTVKTVEGNKTATTSVNVVGKRVTSVSLDKQDINLRVGEGEKLTASVLPGDADDTSVEWSSDNPKIVKVDANGNVTAVGEGTAKIRATTYDGGFVAECQVTATPIPVTSIKLSESKLTLDVGAAKTLTATVAPTNATYKDVVWSSSKKAVATVDSNGKITAKSPGLAVIAATTADGNKKATCEVAVRLPSPAIKSVATAGDRKVKVVWAGVKGATGYSIYRAKSANGNPVKIGDASSSSTSYTASVGYSKYWYSVVALYGADARCNSNASSAVAFNTLLPPTMTEISSNGKSITVEWKKASGATKYYIYRAKGKGEFAKVKTTEKTSWTDKNVEKDVIYTYRVKSWRKSSDGNELLSDTFSNNKRIENSLAFIWPIKGISNGDITSEFGDSDNRNTSHKGIDIGVKTGTTVVAAAAGTVEVAMYGKSGSGYGGFGRVVVIDHGNGIKTLYAHNKEWTVEKGDKVKQGQKIAVSNNSGDSKGAHLHFEVRVNGERKNPRNYLPKL